MSRSPEAEEILEIARRNNPNPGCPFVETVVETIEGGLSLDRVRALVEEQGREMNEFRELQSSLEVQIEELKAAIGKL